MRLTALGCSGGIGAGLRTTAFLLDDDILLDAGTGVGDLELDAMRAIRHVFVTHSHLDHVAAIPLLVDTLFQDLVDPLVIHGQQVTIQALKDHVLNWTIWPDFAELPTPGAPVMTYRPMKPGDVTEVGGRQIEMIPVEHAVPGVGYHVSLEGRSFCFSGDTSTNDTLWEALNAKESLDLLVVECAFLDADAELAGVAKHYCPSLLAADLAKLRHRPRVAITHLAPGDEQAIFDQCRAALPGWDLIRLETGTQLTV